VSDKIRVVLTIFDHNPDQIRIRYTVDMRLLLQEIIKRKVINVQSPRRSPRPFLKKEERER
jgi:hypothetical protein